MLAAAFDVVLAFLIAAHFGGSVRLAISLTAGAGIGLTFVLGNAVIDYVPGGLATLRSADFIATHAGWCALCAAVSAQFVRPA